MIAQFFPIKIFYRQSFVNPDQKFNYVTTPDGCALETYEIISSEQPSKAYIVHVNPNGVVINADNCRQRMDYYSSPKSTNHIFFNYRGTGQSDGEPNSAADLQMDVIAQVNNLLSRKITNITLDGHSLGGATAMLTAAYFKARGINIHVLHDRSLYKLGAWFFYPRGSSTINTNASMSKKETRKIVDRSLRGYILRTLIKFLGLEMHTGRASLLLNKDQWASFSAKDDEVIL